MGTETFMGRRLADYDAPVRGDAITGERYYSRTWMQAEWKHLFSKVCRTGKARPAVP